MAFQIKIDGVVVETRETQEEAIAAATHQRPKSRWVEVRSPEGFQVFSEHEFNQDDHDQAVKGLIGLLEESDSSQPSEVILDHLRRTVSLTKTTLLTLSGRYGYAGVELSRYQLIAKPHVAGCNKHVYVITEGYSEGYRADLYETKATALEALVERIGASSIPLDILF